LKKASITGIIGDKMEGRIKLLFVLPSLVTGGAEKVALNIAKFLKREKFLVKICLFEKKGELLGEVPKYIEVLNLKKRNRWSFPFLSFRIRKIMKYFQPDIIVSWLWYATSVVAIANMFQRRKPPFFIAYEPHNHKKDVLYEPFTSLKSFLINYSHKMTDLVITVSHGAAKDISRSYNLRHNSVKVIYNPIDIHSIQRLAKEKVTLPFPKRGIPIIVTFGRLIKRKGFDYLIKAFHIVRKETPCKLLIIGEGEERTNLEQLVKGLKMEGDIIFLGYQSNPYKFLSSADVFVFSSLWEGFGNVIVEAMACGVPVIATRCPYGPDEIITHGENGLLVSVGDVKAIAEAILRLLREQTLRKRLSEAAKRRAYDFRVEEMVAEYERTFFEIVRYHNNEKCLRQS